MKKYFLSIVLAFVAVFTFAQTNPNRLLVVEKGGYFQGFLAERIDSMFFDKITDPVKVDVTLHEFNNDDPENQTMIVSFKRTKECWSYQFDIIPKTQADVWDNNAVVNYFRQQGSTKYLEDFDHGQMSGFTPLTSGGEYSIVALGYDHYGIPCEVTRADFTVPAQKAEGNPSVTWTADDVQSDKITLTITPNEDCDRFYICLFEAGKAEEEFQMWAPMFGFATIADMIKGFSGTAYYSEKTNTWEQLKPGTAYEIYIVPCDANDIPGENVIANVSTKQLGGEGLAEMTITIGEFGYQTDEDGVNHYYQQIIYTPNDQTAAHRDMMLKKSAIDEGAWTEESFIEYMKNEKNPDYADDPYWDNFGVDDVKWNAEPNTTYYVYSIGKNAKGEWGPVAKETVTTGDAAKGKAKVMMNNDIAQRKDVKRIKNFDGRAMIKNQIRIVR